MRTHDDFRLMLRFRIGLDTFTSGICPHVNQKVYAAPVVNIVILLAGTFSVAQLVGVGIWRMTR